MDGAGDMKAEHLLASDKRGRPLRLAVMRIARQPPVSASRDGQLTDDPTLARSRVSCQGSARLSAFTQRTGRAQRQQSCATRRSTNLTSNRPVALAGHGAADRANLVSTAQTRAGHPSEKLSTWPAGSKPRLTP
jgi:hypothetical protein